MAVKPGESASASPSDTTTTTTQAPDSSSGKPAAESPDSTTGKDGSVGVKAPGSSLEAMMQAQELITQDADNAKADSKVGASPDSETAGKGTEGTDQVTGTETDGETDQSKKDAPARVKELLAERKELLTENASLKERADVQDQLASWCTARNVTQEDFEKGMGYLNLFKNDPHEAYKQFKPVWEQLERYVGVVLPDDLAQKVQAGTIDEETAHELAEQRSRAASAETRRAHVEETTAAERQAQQTAIHTRNVMAAVSAWENDWKSKDPDYQRKQPFVTTEITALMATEGYPRTTKEAIVQAGRARENVEKRLHGMFPTLKSKTVVTGGTITGTAAPQPQSSLEAMQQAEDKWRAQHQGA